MIQEQKLTPSQKMMVFILAMATFGLADLLTEVIPEISFGPIDISIAYFAFIPITLAVLFDPLSAALGAGIGELIFGDLLMGNFGGLGEIEGFLQLTLAIFIAGMIVSKPTDRKQIIISALVMVGIDKGVGGVVDILKIVIGVEGFEAVAGLPESVFVLEGIAFLTDMMITGIIFGVIPSIYLIPKLYGKIEPLLGLKPRTARPQLEWKKVFTPKMVWISISLMVISGIVAILSELDFNLLTWEPDFIEKFGNKFIGIPMLIAGVVIILVITYMLRTKSKSKTDMSTH